MSGAIERKQRSFESVATSARAARQFVAEQLRGYGAPTAIIDDCVLVVSELVSNIVEHGDGSDLVVSLDVTDPDWWHIEVTGPSAAAPQLVLHPEDWSIAHTDEVSGRGLGIVRRLMDHVTTHVSRGQLVVHCRIQRSEPAW